MHLRFAVLLGGLGLADLAYIDFALGPRVLASAPVAVSPLAAAAATPEPTPGAPGTQEHAAGLATPMPVEPADLEPPGGGSSLAGPARAALEPLRDESRIVGNFETGHDALAPSVEEELRRLASQFTGSHDLELEIVGHSDERGERAYNWALGKRRAQAVALLLQELGFAPEQLSVRSAGEDRPAARGTDEQALAVNRRVEIVVRARRSRKP